MGQTEDLLEGNEISEEGLELTCASRSYEDPRTKDVFAQLLVARLSGIPEFTKSNFLTTALVTLSRLQEGKWSFEYGSPFQIKGRSSFSPVSKSHDFFNVSHFFSACR